MKKKDKHLGKYMTAHWQLYVMIALPLILLIIFSYVPMYGILLAFKDYKVTLGIWNSPWTSNHGLNNFIRFFNNYNFKECLRNTIVISLYSMVVSMPCSIILALSLNYAKNVKFKKTVQMISYCPYFISTIVFVGIIMPTAVIMMILNMGSILNIGYEKILAMQNQNNIAMSEVISTYSYKVSLVSTFPDYPYATAIGLFQSLVGLLLIIITNKVADKLTGNGFL